MSLRIVLLTLVSALALAPEARACPTHDIELPAPGAKGPAKEVKVLLDTPFVKVASITLRGGTVLAKHAAPEAVTLQALSGSGKVRAADKADALGKGHMVLLAPGLEHEVVPDGTEDLVVLVHFLKVAGAETAEAHACEGKDCAHHGAAAKGSHDGHACQGKDCQHGGAKTGGHACKEKGCKHGAAAKPGDHAHH